MQGLVMVTLSGNRNILKASSSLGETKSKRMLQGLVMVGHFGNKRKFVLRRADILGDQSLASPSIMQGVFLVSLSEISSAILCPYWDLDVIHVECQIGGFRV